MVAALDRLQRIRESHLKVCKPFVLDESLCLYSPQDNVDALEHSRIRDWFRFIADRYVPERLAATRRVLLLMPCTKTKPYPLSLEHLRINQALFAAGFAPVGDLYPPAVLVDSRPAEFARDLLNLSPLANERGTVLYRAVISEPLAFVPYEHILAFEGKPSPATAYDDPGLFEKRGNAVSPWRKDCTAVRISATRWRWGAEERRGYVAMHNAMAEMLARVIHRLDAHYDVRIAWVAPGLTHRSFVIAADERNRHGISAFRRAGAERLRLVGANDLLPDALRLACLPTMAQCRDARLRLAARLGRDPARVGGVYSRGGGGATPLALPELLENLIGTLLGEPGAGGCRR